VSGNERNVGAEKLYNAILSLIVVATSHHVGKERWGLLDSCFGNEERGREYGPGRGRSPPGENHGKMRGSRTAETWTQGSKFLTQNDKGGVNATRGLKEGEAEDMLP